MACLHNESHPDRAEGDFTVMRCAICGDEQRWLTAHLVAALSRLTTP